MSMDKFEIVSESAPAPVKVGKRWRVTVARPGKGSSGSYPAEVLRETGPAAFPPGTKSFFTHDSKRDPRDMVGTFPDGAFWNEEEQELQADLEPFPRYREVLNQAGTAIEASIRARANKDASGRVRELLYDRANSVDLVSYAGLEGSGLKFAVEDLFAAVRDADDADFVDESNESDADASAQIEKEGMNMELEKVVEDLKTEVASLAASFKSFAEESRKEAQGVADEKAVEAVVQTRVAEALTAYREKEAEIDNAKLLPKLADGLKARALAGEDISEALAEAKAIVEEAAAAFGNENDADIARRGNIVVVTESANGFGGGDNGDIKIGRWGK